MNPYQNYLQPNMTQNMNNQFNNYVQGLQNQISTLQNQIQNYQQYFNNMQQQVPSQQNSGIVTQIVESFENIPANSVPMDNNGAIFALRDGSEIQTRRWTPDGKITTTSYKPISDGFNSDVSDSANVTEKLKLGLLEEVTQAFQNDIENIMNKLDVIEGFLTPKRTNRAKKEVESDE